MQGVWLDEAEHKVTIVGVGQYNFHFLNLSDAREGYEIILKYYEKATSGKKRKAMDWEKIDKEMKKKSISCY